MSEFKNLRLEFQDGILTITINRPDKLNALNVATVEEIRMAMDKVYDEKDIKAVIFTGEGDKAFVAGADISEIAQLNEMNGRKFAENGQEVFSLIENCDKPIIAAVNGFALGGGCELAMACHMRVATESAKFGQPEVNLGVVPGYGGTQRLTHLVGKGKAMELLMSGDMMNANEAKELNLVNYVVADKEELHVKCNEILRKIISKAPLAVGMVIHCVNAAYDPEEKGYQTEANSFANCCKSEDFREGTSAFLEKRKPEFQGE
ncbi:enoyl-CoA hydratase-related protein [Fulvivirgaceae bacterium BMA10]|uniref:Enoyl-CoA hydratase-related protein n=1 Tax=Splendidivirga corallicola TaxID=3051826 RepID=A0ABT8KLJ8_9BACT|nr:enoyl-CoA hydratase-related protein [Fulvivirgaceae bacterium BMA10]